MQSQLRKRLGELDAQIVEQRRLLYQLLQTRSDVERELHATATYPVLTLPTEVAAEIFAHCLQIFDTPTIPKCADSAPIVLAHVCRAWRDIVLSTPILWSKLHVQFDEIAPSQKEFIEGITDAWLSRAKGHPLSLDFSYLGFYRDEVPKRFRDIIHRWSHRVEHLYVDIGRGDFRLLELNSAAFPLLQGATLRCQKDPNDQRPAILFGDAVRLHDLKLLPWFEGLNLRKFALPWLQLTKFHGNLRDLQLFTLAPNLAEIACTFNAEADDCMMITHRSLRSLIIVDDDSVLLLRYLTLPALQCLDASNIQIYDHDDLELVVSFLKRSTPPLVSLSFLGYQIAHWAQCTPLVADTLKILDIDLDDQDLPFFLNSLDTTLPSFKPNIQTLSFKTLKPSDLSALVHFLYARSNTIRTFRAVWASDSDRLPDLDCMVCAGPASANHFDTIGDHLWRLGQSGMEIYLQTERS